jgi:hypothetical protein
LLTVFSSLRDEQSGYMVGWLDAQSKQYHTINNSKNSNGVYSGTDRLLPEDKFYVVDFSSSSDWQLLRVRDQWRYEFNLLSIDDSTYHVLGSLDFEPPQGTENPKYDPTLLVVPACLQSVRSNTLMVFTGPLANPLKQPGKTGSLQLYQTKKEVIKK